MSAINAAVLQLPGIGMSSTQLYRYVRHAHKSGVRLLLLGEYLLNPFFHELRTLSLAMIKEQSEHQLRVLKELCATYDMTIVAPLVTVKKGKPFKTAVKVSPHSTGYYDQQILIDYPHWNEQAFYANEISVLKEPMIFTVDGVRCAVLFGFELHFDPFFAMLDAKNIDLLLVPSVSTFESSQRWQELIRMRAFTHHCYILRANRIGEYRDGEYAWRFYGDSLCVSPDGTVAEHLGNTEELMIAHIDHQAVREARRGWGFVNHYKHRMP